MRGFINIFRRSNEENVAGVVLYADSSDLVLYKDEDLEKKVSKDELVNLFNKGILVINDGEGFYFRPENIQIEDGYAYVTRIAGVTTGESVTTELTYDNYFSDGKPAEE